MPAEGVPQRIVVAQRQQPVPERRVQQEGDDGQPGTIILITEATYAHVKDQVQVDPGIPPCHAKGKAEPIRVYRMLGLSELSQDREA